MNRGSYVALEAAGMVIAVLSAPAVLHGVFRPDSEPLWAHTRAGHTPDRHRPPSGPVIPGGVHRTGGADAPRG
jgi:hypothetical protein